MANQTMFTAATLLAGLEEDRQSSLQSNSTSINVSNDVTTLLATIEQLNIELEQEQSASNATRTNLLTEKQDLEQSVSKLQTQIKKNQVASKQLKEQHIKQVEEIRRECIDNRKRHVKTQNSNVQLQSQIEIHNKERKNSQITMDAKNVELDTSTKLNKKLTKQTIVLAKQLNQTTTKLNSSQKELIAEQKKCKRINIKLLIAKGVMHSSTKKAREIEKQSILLRNEHRDQTSKESQQLIKQHTQTLMDLEKQHEKKLQFECEQIQQQHTLTMKHLKIEHTITIEKNKNDMNEHFQKFQSFQEAFNESAKEVTIRETASTKAAAVMREEIRILKVNFEVSKQVELNLNLQIEKFKRDTASTKAADVMHEEIRILKVNLEVSQQEKMNTLKEQRTAEKERHESVVQTQLKRKQSENKIQKLAKEKEATVLQQCNDKIFKMQKQCNEKIFLKNKLAENNFLQTSIKNAEERKQLEKRHQIQMSKLIENNRCTIDRMQKLQQNKMLQLKTAIKLQGWYRKKRSKQMIKNIASAQRLDLTNLQQQHEVTLLASIQTQSDNNSATINAEVTSLATNNNNLLITIKNLENKNQESLKAMKQMETDLHKCKSVQHLHNQELKELQNQAEVKQHQIVSKHKKFINELKEQHAHLLATTKKQIFLDHTKQSELLSKSNDHSKDTISAKWEQNHAEMKKNQLDVISNHQKMIAASKIQRTVLRINHFKEIKNVTNSCKNEMVALKQHLQRKEINLVTTHSTTVAQLHQNITLGKTKNATLEKDIFLLKQKLSHLKQEKVDETNQRKTKTIAIENEARKNRKENHEKITTLSMKLLRTEKKSVALEIEMQEWKQQHKDAINKYQKDFQKWQDEISFNNKIAIDEIAKEKKETIAKYKKAEKKALETQRKEYELQSSEFLSAANAAQNGLRKTGQDQMEKCIKEHKWKELKWRQEMEEHKKKFAAHDASHNELEDLLKEKQNHTISEINHKQTSELEVLNHERSELIHRNEMISFECNALNKEHDLLKEQLKETNVLHERDATSRMIELVELRRTNEWLDEQRQKKYKKKFESLEQKHAMFMTQAWQAKTSQEEKYNQTISKYLLSSTLKIKEIKEIYENELFGLRGIISTQKIANEKLEERTIELEKEHLILNQNSETEYTTRNKVQILELKKQHSQEINRLNQIATDEAIGLSHKLSTTYEEDQHDLHDMHERHLKEIKSRHKDETVLLRDVLKKERQQHHNLVRGHAKQLSTLTDEFSTKEMQFSRENSLKKIEMSRLKETLKQEQGKYEMLQHRLEIAMDKNKQIEQIENDGDSTSVSILQQQLSIARSTAKQEKDKQTALQLEETNNLVAARKELLTLKNIALNKEIEYKNNISKMSIENEQMHEKYDRHLDDVIQDREGSVERILGMERNEIGRLRKDLCQKITKVLSLKATIRTLEHEVHQKNKSHQNEIKQLQKKYNSINQTCVDLRKCFSTAVEVKRCHFLLNEQPESKTLVDILTTPKQERKIGNEDNIWL